MNNLFQNVKSVGFDLDNTLYPINEEIDNKIKREFAKAVLEKIPGLKNLEGAIEFSERRYIEIGSRTQVFRELGFSDPWALAEKCMVTAEFTDLLKYNRKVVSLLEKIKRKYDTFLITGSNRELSLPRLKKLGISLSLFDSTIFGDNPEGNIKADGSIYKHFLDQSKYSPKQHVYIGDRLRADILPTKSLGMKTIAVGEEIKEANFSVNKIQDIKGLLL